MTHSEDNARRRRERLAQLKVEALADRDEPELGDDAGDDPELDAFLEDLVEKKNRRKTQLALVKAFFSDPLRFGTGLKQVTGDASEQDIADRRAFLEDQIDLLSGILEAAETELEQLDTALKTLPPDAT